MDTKDGSNIDYVRFPSISTDSYLKEQHELEQMLSKGSLLEIRHGLPSVIRPIFQLLDIFNVHGKPWYRLTISDGSNFTCAVKLSEKKNDLVISNTFANFCIFRVLNYRCIDADGIKVIHIHDLEILILGEVIKQKVGNPIYINNDETISA